MPGTLTIPGVQVRTQFEPSPVLPSATGILGVVGVADRGPVDPTPVGSLAELVETFGPATRYTMPEVRTAFTNGVLQAVVARTAPGRGTKASLVVSDTEGEEVVTLEARAEGAWGERISVRFVPVKTAAGAVKYVNLEVSLDGALLETIPNLVTDPDSPAYLYDRINDGSSVVVAYDPLFEKGLPAAAALTPLADAAATAAFAVLKSGATNVLRVDAKRAGEAGNLIAVQVADGRASLALTGAADAPSLELVARTAGPGGTGIKITVQPAGAGAVNLVVSPPAGSARTLGPFTSVDDLVAALAADPDVAATKQGDALPAASGPTALGRRVDITVFTEGRDSRRYEGLGSLADVAAVRDAGVAFSVVGAATHLPDADQGEPLTGGRDKGPALELTRDGDDQPLLELVPASSAPTALGVAITQGVSTLDGATSVVGLTVQSDGEVVETYSNLTMDPDDPLYLPHVLGTSSAFLRAHDLFVRSRTTSFPAGTPRPQPLKGGVSPSTDDYTDALERLESAEEVDLVIASVANQLDDASVRTVHQAVVAHCTKMGDVARNRIGLGSVTEAESDVVSACLDHADDVRSDTFILSAPARSEAALAGLLGHQDYFESPTFKTIASLGAPAGSYTDAELTQLILGNVCVVNERRRVGVIVVKGLLTSGRQINVQRIANKAVRDVKAICAVYIGLLNNDGARNALKQQITALLLQMERDGALVPSTDGTDPAFKVDVYATEADFANGIVRVDIAVRPVRAIDYVYATILVQN